jgi:hypothetical protein
MHLSRAPERFAIREKFPAISGNREIAPTPALL